MSEQQLSPIKRSALQRLNEENIMLREQLSQIREEKIELQRVIKKQQYDLKVQETKYQALQGELQKIESESHRYLEAYEKQKKQRVELVNKQHSTINDLNRQEAELNKLTSENKLLKEQLEGVERAFQQQKSERVSALREKQNNANKIKLLETKLEAANMENKYAKTKQLELVNQNQRLRKQLAQSEKLLLANHAPLQVQTIYKHSNQTTEKLLTEFETRMKEKETQMISEIQKYESKNSALLNKIADLQLQLLRVTK